MASSVVSSVDGPVTSTRTQVPNGNVHVTVPQKPAAQEEEGAILLPKGSFPLIQSVADFAKLPGAGLSDAVPFLTFRPGAQADQAFSRVWGATPRTVWRWIVEQAIPVALVDLSRGPLGDWSEKSLVRALKAALTGDRTTLEILVPRDALERFTTFREAAERPKDTRRLLSSVSYLARWITDPEVGTADERLAVAQAVLDDLLPVVQSLLS